MPEILQGYREEKIDLKKIYKGRWFFAQALVKELSGQGRYGLSVRAVFEQGLKGMVDTLAVASGLNYRLLRHRARPITDTEQSEWEKVWQMVNKTEVS